MGTLFFDAKEQQAYTMFHLSLKVERVWGRQVNNHIEDF